jgi:hypothetical protein
VTPSLATRARRARHILARLGVLTVLAGCGQQLTPRVAQCRLEALKPLPDDPLAVTPYDVADLVDRLKACRDNPDGGQ